MLHGRRRHGELEGVLGGRQVVEAPDEPRSEGVAAPDAVHDVPDLVLPALHESPLVVRQNGGPAVPVGAHALPEADGEVLHVRVGAHDLRGELPVLGRVEAPRGDVHVDLDAEALLAVLFIGYGDVHIPGDLAHDLLGRPPPLPQLLPVVQVAGHGDPLFLAGLHRLEGHLRRPLGDGRRDPRGVEPGDPVEDAVPVEVPGLHLGDGRPGAVVDDLGRPHGGARLGVVHAEAAARPPDEARVHVEGAQLPDHGVAHGVLRGRRDVGHVLAVVGQGNGHVGLGAPEGGDEAVRLEEHLVVGRRQTQHDLSERDESGHGSNPLVIESMVERRGRCPPFARRSVVQVARHGVPRSPLPWLGHPFGALGHGPGAAWVEVAARGRVQRGGDVAPQDRPLLLRPGDGDGRGGEQGLGVGVQGVAEQVVLRSDLHDLSQVHDRHPVADVLHHAEVVGHEEVGQREPLPKIGQQIDDLRLNGDVQRRDGFVGHDQGRVEDERPRNADALAAAAVQLMGVAVNQPFCQAYGFHQFQHAVLDLMLIREDAVHPDGLGDNLIDRLLGIQGGERILKDNLHITAQFPHLMVT